MAACLLTTLTLAAACGGGGVTAPPPPSSPQNLQYPIDPQLCRVGEAILANVPSVQGGAPTSWQVAPPLPNGIVLDPGDGTLSGTPVVEAGMTTHTITASNAAGQTQDTVDISVGPALPAAFESLMAGFSAEVVLEPGVPVPAKIAKIAIAPTNDDRIFYTEVDTGNVRVIDPVAGLLPTPFASINVLNGGHNGLLGLALAPDFAVSGHVYAMACVPDDGMGKPDRMKIFRYTDANSVGTNEQVVLDDLPITPPGGVNNGGEICFASDGTLFVSIGDVQDPNNSQVDAFTSLAGKVLRYDVSSLPAQPAAGNPFVGSPEWCRGLRNTFGLAVHPTTGDLFGVDNGPAADDELNFLQAGKNFEWQNANPPPAERGYKIQNYQTVIVPTGICWHDGTTWGAAFANNLFLVAYDDHILRRFEMSGAAFTDIDDETEFAELRLVATNNIPLDVCMAPDGSLYVSTFSGIYRITKQ